MSKHIGVFENKKGIFVEVRSNNVENAIRLLTRKVKQAGILREVRARQYYEKPSDIKRKQKAEAIARHRKQRAKNGFDE